MLELRQLQLFVGVAEELHFGRAAERLFITQPALSRHVQALELAIGGALLTRSRRGVQLTAAGSVLLDHARRVLAAAHDAEIAAHDAARGATGRLRVGFASHAAYGVLPRIVRGVGRSAPGTTLELRQLGPVAQIEALRDRALDIAFVYAPAPDTHDLLQRVVARQPLVAVLPACHRLAARVSVGGGVPTFAATEATGDAPRIAALALELEPFVFFPREAAPALYDPVIALCRNAGFSPRVVHETEGPHTVSLLVAAGMGVSIIPTPLSWLRSEDVVYAALRDPHPPVELTATWRRDNENPALVSLLEVVEGMRDPM